MMLILTLLTPILGAFSALRSGRKAQQFGIGVLGLALILLLNAWFEGSGAAEGAWRSEVSLPWISSMGVRLHFALDGLSLVLSLLTLLLGAAGLYQSRTEIRTGQGGFTALYLLTLGGLLGVFLAQDLFVFFVFYEIMLVPAYFLLTHWGEDRQGRAATTFFIFTQTSGLLLLVSILVLNLYHARATGEWTFDAATLIGTADGTGIGMLILLGFFIAFAVKLPLVPFHTWQAPTYAAAPASVGILLGGIMSKAGAYGLLRFAAPLLPESTTAFAPTAMILACVSLVYCSVLAYGQRDLKRLIAYSSAGHLAFVVLGVFAQNEYGYAGVVATIVAHAVSVSGLFVLAGYLEQSSGTRDLDALGGIWQKAPRTGALAIVIAMATLGLPGLGNFIGEFLVLLGTFRVSPGAAAVGACGAVLGAVYALLILQRSFLGSTTPRSSESAEAPRQTLILLATFVVVLLWLGLRPQCLLDLTAPERSPLLAESPAHEAGPAAETTQAGGGLL